jgi:hypothetical protein
MCSVDIFKRLVAAQCCAYGLWEESNIDYKEATDMMKNWFSGEAKRTAAHLESR